MLWGGSLSAVNVQPISVHCLEPCCWVLWISSGVCCTENIGFLALPVSFSVLFRHVFIMRNSGGTWDLRIFLPASTHFAENCFPLVHKLGRLIGVSFYSRFVGYTSGCFISSQFKICGITLTANKSSCDMFAWFSSMRYPVWSTALAIFCNLASRHHPRFFVDSC